MSSIYYIYICLHINAYICLPFICLTSRERWKLFLRVRHDHIGITLQHSVFAYHVSSIFRKKSTLWPFKKPSIIMKWNIVISFIRSFFQSICNTHCQSLIVYTRAKTDTTHSPWTATHRVVIRAEFSYVTAFATLISETTKSTNILGTEPRLKGGEMTGLSPAPWPSGTFNPLQTAKHTSRARKRSSEDHFFNLFFPLPLHFCTW